MGETDQMNQNINLYRIGIRKKKMVVESFDLVPKASLFRGHSHRSLILAKKTGKYLRFPLHYKKDSFSLETLSLKTREKIENIFYKYFAISDSHQNENKPYTIFCQD
ncbi:Hypothetical predicted protein [Octopus vulgaris]|uniref:Uncharacterized protein n=1 Tax=Octopus vulgaris TaxID=6645 RepID=A0AA36AG74_OCTVU|nr:Hypothetical predicted protein [Octopus vulgaris]